MSIAIEQKPADELWQEIQNYNILPDTNPNSIEKVGAAILYILRSHDIYDVKLPDIIKNTRHIQETDRDDLLGTLTGDVSPKTLEVFDTGHKNYYFNIRNWNYRTAERLEKNTYKNATKHIKLLEQGKAVATTAIGVVDSRLCEDGCNNTVYIVNLLKDINIFGVEMNRVLCGDSSKLCKNVIGAVSGYAIKRI